jgi:hypothetical protein
VSASAAEQVSANGGEPRGADVEQPLRALDAAHGTPRSGHARLMVGDPIPALLTPTELRAALGYGRTQFWRLERAGAFDDLLANIGPGVRAYSGARLAERLRAGNAVDVRQGRRYFGSARHAATTKQSASQPSQKHPVDRGDL